MLCQITFWNLFLLMSSISAASVLSKRDAAFLQTYNDQSSATNIAKRDAGVYPYVTAGVYPLGVAGVYPHVGQSTYYQTYNHNSHATNYGKRDASFLQNYNDQSSATNVAGVAAHGAQDNFYQNYNHNSHATNIAKRDARVYPHVTAGIYPHVTAGVYPLGVAGVYPHVGQSTYYQTYNHNSHATNYGKRDADAQFDIQNYGGINTNYDCKYGGCPGETTYNQQYHHGSSANNYDLGKRDARFIQEYNHQSTATNIAGRK